MWFLCSFVSVTWGSIRGLSLLIQRVVISPACLVTLTEGFVIFRELGCHFPNYRRYPQNHPQDCHFWRAVCRCGYL